MGKRRKDINALMKRVSEQAEGFEPGSVKRKEFLIKILKLIEKDLDQEEKIMVLDYLMEELSYKTVVESPDFIHKQYSAKAVPMLIGGAIGLILIVVLGLMFSENSWVHSINTVISSLFYKMGVG